MVGAASVGVPAAGEADEITNGWRRRRKVGGTYGGGQAPWAKKGCRTVAAFFQLRACF